MPLTHKLETILHMQLHLMPPIYLLAALQVYMTILLPLTYKSEALQIKQTSYHNHIHCGYCL